MKPYYGEQGFPQRKPLTCDCHSMSLRDYFAAQVLQAAWMQCREPPDENWRAGVASEAYRMADAMLKTREVKE